MMAIGLLWAALAPLSLVLAVVLAVWLLRRFGPAGLSKARATIIAALIVLAPVAAIYAVDRSAFAKVCAAEAGAAIAEKASADGVLLNSPTANSFGMRYLQDEGFSWFEARDIYKRGHWVRYARDDKGAVVTTPVDAPTARYEVREDFEQRPGIGVSKVDVVDRQTGKAIAHAASLTFDGGRLVWLLGAWGVASCPSAYSDPEGFRAFYHLAKDTLRP